MPRATLLFVWAITSVQLPLSGAAVVAVLLLFPTNRFDWPYARPTFALAVVGAILLVVASAFRPQGLLWYPNLPNPVAAPSELGPLVAAASVAGVACFVIALVLCVVCLAWRFRRASSRDRRALAWVARGHRVMCWSSRSSSSSATAAR